MLLGVAVLFIAFSGGPGAAREAYLTRGGPRVQDRDPAASTSALGVVVPALVLANREAAAGGTGALRTARAR